MIFASQRPHINSTYIPPFSIEQPILTHTVPTSLPTWDFLFSSSYSPLGRHPASSLAGYTNAVTKERVRYDDLKDHTTHISTALVKNYGLQKGDTVALFSPNTIWYPVAMLATIRAGTYTFSVNMYK